MAVEALYALQNGFIGAERSLLFYGEYSEARVQIPIACWLVKTSTGLVLFDTGVSPRAVPGLMRNDPLARFADEDLLVHRLDSLGMRTDDVGTVVMSHLHYDHAGGAQLFPKAELVVQKDEYAYAHYPASFFEPFYYRKNFDLPGYRWRLLDGDTELLAGTRAAPARTRSRLESHARAALDQAHHHAGPPARRAGVPRPRSRVLEDGDPRARRVPLRNSSPVFGRDRMILTRVLGAPLGATP
jgi:Metallo-beta-lactamase superfamily